MFMMIDNKVCNAVTDTKSILRCYLCGATSKDFNNINDILQKEITETNLRFEISSLHAWIRLFECCLHLSYRLKIKKWQARRREEKDYGRLQKNYSKRIPFTIRTNCRSPQLDASLKIRVYQLQLQASLNR